MSPPPNSADDNSAATAVDGAVAANKHSGSVSSAAAASTTSFNTSGGGVNVETSPSSSETALFPSGSDRVTYIHSQAFKSDEANRTAPSGGGGMTKKTSVDPATVSSSVAGGYNNRQYPSGYNQPTPQQQQQQQKVHYSQWPLPPHPYTAGRQQSSEEGAAGVDSSSSSTIIVASMKNGSNHSKGGDASEFRSNSRASNGSGGNNNNEELIIKKKDANKKPQAIYSSNNAPSSSAPPAAPWGGHPHQHPHHPSHPHHPHHAQYQAHYQQWYRHYAHHHHQQQQRHQQQQQGPHGQQQAHHPHYHHWHRQQHHPHQQHYQPQMSKTSSTANGQHQQQSHHHSSIYPTRSNDSSTNGTKRTVHELSTADSRDDNNTVQMKEEQEDDSSCTMSLGDFSMTSLGSSSPKGKRLKGSKSQKHHSYDDDDTNSLALSDKEIMNNLSMNSSYSSEMAMLYGASPTNSVVHRDNQVCDDLDLGKTPKKNNTSSKKPRPYVATNMDDAVFRMDSMTPRFRSASDTDDESSPALLDLIGGAETPTTGLLMSSIENAMMDDIHSLNRNLRGHAFTPLPHIMGGGGDAALGSSGDASGLSITPQLSWSTNNGSPLDITPRCFGLLDSSKSTNKNPLGSPKSFWKESTASSDEKKKDGSGEKPSILSLLSPTMREMEISHHMSIDGSRSTTPLPLNYGKKEAKNEKEQVKFAEFNQKTPVHKPPAHGPMMGMQQPPVHHMSASPWAQLGGYMPSPVPGAFPSMSPGFGMYPPMEPITNDRIRNLRGRGPPVHAIPPSHCLPPPTYHHFSPLTNVMKRPVRPMSFHPTHSNVPPLVDVSSSSKSNCVPMKPPIPSKFQGDMNKYKDVSVPDFNNLVNFPCHMNQKTAPAPDGTRSCVMCGHSCPCTTGGKQKGKNGSSHPLADNNQNKGGSSSGLNNNIAIIPSQNKGLCTLCDVNVWIVLTSGLEIKWCKGCKNFRPWASFGEKGLATKCVRCRERQREKYAMEKEKKERAKTKPANASARVMATSN